MKSATKPKQKKPQAQTPKELSPEELKKAYADLEEFAEIETSKLLEENRTLRRRDARLTKQRAENLLLIEELRATVRLLQPQHSQQLEEMKLSHAKEIADLKAKQAKTISELQTEYSSLLRAYQHERRKFAQADQQLKLLALQEAKAAAQQVNPPATSDPGPQGFFGRTTAAELRALTPLSPGLKQQAPPVSLPTINVGSAFSPTKKGPPAS